MRIYSGPGRIKTRDVVVQQIRKWNLYLPPELGYGERGPLADETLIFEVELLSITAAKTK